VGSRRRLRLAGIAALAGVVAQVGVVLLQFTPRGIPASLAGAGHSYDGQLLSAAIFALPWALFMVALVALQTGIAPHTGRIGWLAATLMVAGVLCFLVAVEGALRIVPRACYFLICADDSYLPALNALERVGLAGALLLGVGAVVYGVRMVRLKLFLAQQTAFLGLVAGALYAFTALPLYVPFVPAVSGALQGDMPAALAGTAWAAVWLVIALGLLRVRDARGPAGMASERAA
jgi:hypothetical protein